MNEYFENFHEGHGGLFTKEPVVQVQRLYDHSSTHSLMNTLMDVCDCVHPLARPDESGERRTPQSFPSLENAKTLKHLQEEQRNAQLSEPPRTWPQWITWHVWFFADAVFAMTDSYIHAMHDGLAHGMHDELHEE